jgi:hypothetical protein
LERVGDNYVSAPLRKTFFLCLENETFMKPWLPGRRRRPPHGRLAGPLCVCNENNSSATLSRTATTHTPLAAAALPACSTNSQGVLLLLLQGGWMESEEKCKQAFWRGKLFKNFSSPAAAAAGRPSGGGLK